MNRSLPRGTLPRRRGRFSLAQLTLLSLLGVLTLGLGQGGALSLRASVARRPAPALAGGIDVGEYDAIAYAAGMRAAGLDTAQVTYYATQGDWDSADLAFGGPGDGSSDAGEGQTGGLERRIESFRRAGLRVQLVLRVEMDRSRARNDHVWHGMIWPRDERLDAWFARYRAYVQWAAEIAQRQGVELLVLGNELNALAGTHAPNGVPSVLRQNGDRDRLGAHANVLLSCGESLGGTEGSPWHDASVYDSMEAAVRAQQAAWFSWAEVVRQSDLRERARRHEDGFREVARVARAAFSGPVSYGAGFDVYDEVGFWDALDAISVTGYFPLRGDAERTPDYAERWTEALEALARFTEGAPTYFVELGFTRFSGSTVLPWSYEGVEALPARRFTVADRDNSRCVRWSDQPRDEGERVAALEGLRDAVRGGALPGLVGFSLWKLTTRVAHWELEPYAILLPPRTGPLDRRMLHVAQELALAVAHPRAHDARLAEALGTSSLRDSPR